MRLVPALGTALLLGLSACGNGGAPPEATLPSRSPTPPSTPPPALLLDFETGLETGTMLDDVSLLTNSGRAVGVGVGVRTNGAARLEVVPGRGGEGHAIRFPEYTGDADAPAAVLVATDDGQGALDPGAGDFTFGASFRLDEDSEGSANDDGNNLLQRGTFESRGQLKIQIDGGVPSCRIQGRAGEVFVEAEDPVETDTWYTVTCARTAGGVTLEVEPDAGSGPGGGTWSADGETGEIVVTGLPLAIGGKAGRDGTPVASADQFNGLVDDVFLDRP